MKFLWLRITGLNYHSLSPRYWQWSHLALSVYFLPLTSIFSSATSLISSKHKSHHVNLSLANFCAVHSSVDTDSNSQDDLEGPALSGPCFPLQAHVSQILLLSLCPEGISAFFQFFKYVTGPLHRTSVTCGVCPFFHPSLISSYLYFPSQLRTSWIAPNTPQSGPHSRHESDPQGHASPQAFLSFS